MVLIVTAINCKAAEIAFELSGVHVRDFALSSKGDDLYVTMESISKDASQIISLQKTGKQWSKPMIASFSGQFKDLEPFLHPNGLQLYFASNRNAAQNASTDHFDIWMTERASLNQPWGDPVKLNTMINTDEGDEFYPSVASNGNLYFTATKADGLGKEDIYVSRLVDGQYTQAEILPAAINSPTYEFNAYIAPDESMLIFSSYGRADDMGGGDLYISHKVDGVWQPAKNMGGQVNSKQLDYCPYYDEINGILYWTSNQSKLKNLPSIERDFYQWFKLMTSGENGLSKVYQMPIKLSL
ncbi:TolB family protein [Marinicella litoralis]|nr:PD40 domain-containing protein [Marinicella litoralis]